MKIRFLYLSVCVIKSYCLKLQINGYNCGRLVKHFGISKTQCISSHFTMILWHHSSYFDSTNNKTVKHNKKRYMYFWILNFVFSSMMMIPFSFPVVYIVLVSSIIYVLFIVKIANYSKRWCHWLYFVPSAYLLFLSDCSLMPDWTKLFTEFPYWVLLWVIKPVLQ